MPVNRAAQKGNWPGSNRNTLPLRAENLGLSPYLCWRLATLSQPKSVGTGSLGQDFLPLLRETKPGDRSRPEFDYIAEAGSTWTPGPMVEDTATRLT